LLDDLYIGLNLDQHQYFNDNFHHEVSFLPAYINFSCTMTQKFLS
jgi:hypothetical protein